MSGVFNSPSQGALMGVKSVIGVRLRGTLSSGGLKTNFKLPRMLSEDQIIKRILLSVLSDFRNVNS